MKKIGVANVFCACANRDVLNVTNGALYRDDAKFAGLVIWSGAQSEHRHRGARVNGDDGGVLRVKEKCDGDPRMRV